MNDEEKRIKLAELSKWKMLPRGLWLHKGDPKNRHPSGRPTPEGIDTEIPNYLEDLNAAHDALMSQPEHIRKAVRFYLCERLGQMRVHEMTARDLSECILLALR